MTMQAPGVPDRLEKLERQVRVLGWSMLILSLLAAGGIAVMRVIMPKRIVTARGFVVTDEQGRPRGELRAVGGAVYLNLYGENGNPRTGLNASGGGSDLTLYGPDGNLNEVLSASKGGAFLSINDGERKMRVQITLGSIGPLIAFYDENGKERATLGYRIAEDNREETGQGERGAALVLWDREGKVLFSAP
jgi:hypothetical protein